MRTRLILLNILLCPILVFATPAEEGTQNPIYWQTRIQKNPEQALNYFNLGVVYQKQGRRNEAVAQYNRVIELKSALAPVAIFYKAQIFEAANQVAEAKELVSEIKIAELPEKLQQTVLAYKNRLYAEEVVADTGTGEVAATNATDSEKKEDEKRLSLFLDISKGRNSNPASYASSASSSISADNQTQTRAGIDYLFSFSDHYDLKGNYFYSQSQFDKQTTLNYKYHDLTLPIGFYFGSWRIKATPEYFFDNYDGSNYSEQKGVSVDTAYKINDDYLNFLLQNNSMQSKNSTYSYLTGYQYKALLGYESRWASSRMTSKIYTSDYHYVDSYSLASSYKAYGLELSFTQIFGPFETILSGAYEEKNYGKATADSFARKDKRTYLSLQAGYNFTSYFQIYVEGNLLENLSNFNTSTNDKAYKQNLVRAGISASY